MTTALVDFQGWRALLLENDHTQLIVLPELGGKIASICSKITGTEFLWQDPTRSYRARVYDDEYGNYDASGFDECFPSIGACAYPGGPWDQIAIPDHGELWCIPWRYELIDERTIYLHAYGVRFPYHFEKWITLADNAAQYTLRYQLTNLSPFAFKSLWSAHPLFAAQPGMRVLLPGTPKMRLTHALGSRISAQLLQEYEWPWLDSPDGAPLDYSLLGPPSLNANDKVYANTPEAGWCALFIPQSREFVAFTLSASETPFIGICINHGGWPPTGARAFWVAIEPCTGWPDRLDEAVQGAYTTLDPWASVTWSLGLWLGQASTADDAAWVVRDMRRQKIESRTPTSDL